MHGHRGSRPPVRLYRCSGRRHGHGCEQPITKAEPLENQLADWLRAFQPTQTYAQSCSTGSPSRHTRKAMDSTAKPHSPTNSVACKNCLSLAISPRHSTSCAAYFQAICENPQTPTGNDRCQERERRDFSPDFQPPSEGDDIEVWSEPPWVARP